MPSSLEGSPLLLRCRLCRIRCWSPRPRCPSCCRCWPSCPRPSRCSCCSRCPRPRSCSYSCCSCCCCCTCCCCSPRHPCLPASHEEAVQERPRPDSPHRSNSRLCHRAQVHLRPQMRCCPSLCRCPQVHQRPQVCHRAPLCCRSQLRLRPQVRGSAQVRHHRAVRDCDEASVQLGGKGGPQDYLQPRPKDHLHPRH